MGRRGPKPKVKAEEVKTASEAVTVVEDRAPETVAAPVLAENKDFVLKKIEIGPKLTGEAMAIAESRKVLSIPLDASQEFFESPEGYIVIGEKGRGRVWCRAANKGAGMWVNPRR